MWKNLGSMCFSICTYMGKPSQFAAMPHSPDLKAGEVVNSFLQIKASKAMVLERAHVSLLAVAEVSGAGTAEAKAFPTNAQGKAPASESSFLLPALPLESFTLSRHNRGGQNYRPGLLHLQKSTNSKITAKAGGTFTNTVKASLQIKMNAAENTQIPLCQPPQISCVPLKKLVPLPNNCRVRIFFHKVPRWSLNLTKRSKPLY